MVTIVLTAALGLLAPRRLLAGRRNLRFLLLYGFILSIFNSLWTVSVALNGAAVSTVLVYSSAGFTALIGWRWFGERLSPVKLLAVGFSLLGCALVSGALDLSAWRLNPLGIVTGLISGLAFAAYSLMGKRAAERGIFPWTTLLYAFGFAAVFLFIYNTLPFLGGNLAMTGNLLMLGSDRLGWALLFLLALVPTIGGYGLYTVSLSYLPASVTNLIATLEPAFTALLSFFLLAERFNPPQWAGSLAIILGVVLLRFDEGQASKMQAVQPPALKRAPLE